MGDKFLNFFFAILISHILTLPASPNQHPEALLCRDTTLMSNLCHRSVPAHRTPRLKITQIYHVSFPQNLDAPILSTILMPTKLPPPPPLKQNHPPHLFVCLISIDRPRVPPGRDNYNYMYSSNLLSTPHPYFHQGI